MANTPPIDPDRTQDDIERLFSTELLHREANAERLTCLIWVVLIATTYSLFILAAESFSPDLVRNITNLVLFMVPAFSILFILIHRGFYAAWMRYLNTFLQVSLVSGAVLLDIRAHGAQYAFSSMPPMAYGLVVAVTAFRLRPAMGLFAGLVAATEFGLIYGLVAVRAEDMTPEVIHRLPSLGWQVTGMKILVLLALGVACSFAAYRVRKQLLHLVKEAVRQAKLKNSLGRFLSPEVANDVINTREGRVPSRRVSAVVIFGDIRGFTHFSQDRDPIEVVEVLNDVFETVNSEICSHGGVLNKYLGDGFLAVFGIYGNQDNMKTAALNSARTILTKCEAKLRPLGLDMGIALSSGTVIAGEIGAAGRCEFTVIGETVNLASRVEGLNKKLGTRLLAPADYFQGLESEAVPTRPMGCHPIRGTSAKVELLEVLLESQTHEPYPKGNRQAMRLREPAMIRL